MNTGIHYYPDTLHFRQADLDTWLPHLHALGFDWLLLRGEATRAIPEAFLRGLLEHGIRPLVHLPLSPGQPPAVDELSLLLQAYRRWGVEDIILFDRPNSRRVWGEQGWSQSNLVERFLDAWLPLAEAALRADLRPVFPPLTPGGDYWDTAFLRAALQSLRRRGPQALLDRLVLGAYAWADEHPLDWGHGGPERWPETRPYHTPPDSQDQRGFRIFEWYIAIAQAVLGRSLPILLVGMGHRHPSAAPEQHTTVNLHIARLLRGAPVDGQPPLPADVLGGCFWLLSAAPHSPQAAAAWFPPQGAPLPIVEALQRLAAKHALPKRLAAARPIRHYLLLPSQAGTLTAAQWNALRPFVREHRPTIGFSLEEARLAERITVLGDERAFPEHLLNALRAAGCRVHRWRPVGTELALSGMDDGRPTNNG